MKYKKTVISVLVIISLLGIKVFAEGEGIKIEETVDNNTIQKSEDKKEVDGKEKDNIKVHVSGEVIRPRHS